MIGVPNLNIRDPKIQLKKKWYSTEYLKKNTIRFDSFSMYYRRQTLQAIIQGLGRGIRSNLDCCFVLLVEERF